MGHVRYRWLPAALLLSIAVAGCSGQHPVAGGAASGPAAATRMVCEAEAEDDITAAIGVSPGRPPTYTWSEQLFTCPYRYPSGTLVLSVKELAGDPDTKAYLATARSGGTPAVDLPGIGEEAFAVADGSVYVRKGFSVLHVDVHGLPASFGQPPYSRGRIAITVADTIMACWRGD